MRSPLHRLSLRSWILVTALVGAGLVAVGFVALLSLSLNARSELARATDAFVEEERIAGAVTLSVMDQLALAFALRTGPEEQLRRAFEASGRQAHEHIRRYLFRDLSAEERLQLESMAEAHQRMEVAALRAADLFGRGRIAEAEASWTGMMDHTREFLGGMDRFLRMREAALDDLQTAQWRTFRVVVWASVLLVLLAVGAAAGMAWLVHRRIAQPLSGLAGASRRLGAGELDVRVPVWSNPELRQLATGFNEMAASLQGATRKLEERNQELSGALDRLQRTQDELVQAEKLSALGRMSAGLAHELNNPLTSVIGYSRLLEERIEELAAGGDSGLVEVRDDLVTPIVSESNRAQQLVRNLLHFTRRAEAQLSAVPLHEAVEGVVELRASQFRDLGLAIEVEPLPDTRVRAERSLLQAAFLNIVNNALDAMRDQGRGSLRIRAESAGDAVRVLFEDDGPGIPDPDQVFEPFFTTKAPGHGTGLGLSLVHRFMEQFGGSAWAENRREGGARFILTLGVVEADAPPDGHAPAEAAPETAVSREAPTKEVPAPLGTGSVPQSPAPAVLVVDDEAPIRALQHRLLERIGLRPLLAESAAEARRILSQEAVAAVLCDVKMPKETGLEFYRWLQANHPELAGRLLFVTGDVGDPELLELLARRPELFLHKPFDLEEYVERVRALLPEELPARS